jgi:hypothetical protein
MKLQNGMSRSGFYRLKLIAFPHHSSPVVKELEILQKGRYDSLSK